MKKFNTSFKPIEIYENKKCLYGRAFYHEKKVFYKKFCDTSKKEIEGYKMVKEYYKVPQVLYYDEKIIIYEYKESLIEKTIHEYLYYLNIDIDYNIILNQYKKALKECVIQDEETLINKNFFKERTYMIDEYIKSNKFERYNEIFKEIIEKIKKKKKLTSIISQGDPTDTNITVDGIFSDFENGGYNSLVGEISILVISLLTHGAYFYPKYNSKVYEIRPFKSKRKVNQRNIIFILEYLNMIKNNISKKTTEELNKYLKYYLCFRVLTPLNVLKMENKDIKKILTLIEIMYKINSLDDLIETIEKWYNKGK